jgi:flagellin
MALSVVTNVASLGAQRSLSKTQDRLEMNIKRLSSGLRVNSAADDAAGLAIGSKLNAQIRGLSQASRNANDAVSVIQTAEGGLAEIDGLLTRMRELGVQAANGGALGSSERTHLDNEYDALMGEIDRIVATTKFNGQALIDGTLSAGTSFQVGAFNTSNDRISVAIDDAGSASLGIDATDLTTVTTAQSAVSLLDTAIESVATSRAALGAAQNRITVTISGLGSMRENLTAAKSRIMDVDVAEETAALARNQILAQAGAAVLSQANALPQMALSLLGR